jgi:hypothetical protein
LCDRPNAVSRGESRGANLQKEAVDRKKRG